MLTRPRMNHGFPLPTYYAIILSSLIALGLTHVFHISGDSALPLFIGAMAVGLLMGEIFERIRDRNRPPL